MNIPKISKRFETSLASSLSAAGTSFSTVSATDDDGNALSGLYALSIDVGNANVEDVIATVSGTTWTVVYRGIDADAPNTEVSGNKKPHSRGAPVVITDYPILGVLRNILNGDATLPNPLRYADGVGPVTASDLVDKEYADALAISGAGLATTDTAGLAEEATEDEINNDDSSGSAGRTFVSPETLATSKYGERLPTADEKAAMEGASGTAVSSSNKLVDEALLASTTLAGLAEEATQAEVDAGTDAGSGGRLFMNPSKVSKHTMGVLPALIAKTYFNIQLLFLNWTGSTSGAATTDFPNWIVTSDATPTPGGAMLQFAGTGAESAQIITGVFASSGSAKVQWSSTNVLIMDWCAKLPASSTGDIQMGMADSIAALNSLYNANTDNKVTFSQNAAGVLYASISKVGVGITTADISSGITTTDWNNYRIEFHGGTDAKFYVNGVLKATLSGANLPSANSTLGVGFGRSNTATFVVTAPNFSLQLI